MKFCVGQYAWRRPRAALVNMANDNGFDIRPLTEARSFGHSRFYNHRHSSMISAATHKRTRRWTMVTSVAANLNAHSYPLMTSLTIASGEGGLRRGGVRPTSGEMGLRQDWFRPTSGEVGLRQDWFRPTSGEVGLSRGDVRLTRDEVGLSRGKLDPTVAEWV